MKPHARGLGCVAVFYQSFVKNDGECWLWTGPKDGCGYGIINASRSKRYRAHRLSLQLESGEMGDGLYACHHCDVPACVRPSHLFWGTQADNMRDALCKGRHLGGAFNAAKTHCPKGHPLSDKRKSDGSRYCPTCCAARNQLWRELNRKPKNASARLAPEQVQEIRTSRKSGVVLAKEYSIATTTVSAIRTHKIWKHLP